MGPIASRPTLTDPFITEDEREQRMFNEAILVTAETRAKAAEAQKGPRRNSDEEAPSAVPIVMTPRESEATAKVDREEKEALDYIRERKRRRSGEAVRQEESLGPGDWPKGRGRQKVGLLGWIARKLNLK